MKHIKSRFKQKVLFAALLAAIVLISGCASQTPKVYHVGIISGAEPFDNIADGFKTGMAELGYIEGKNIIYDFQTTPDATEEQRVSRKFVEDKVDLIFAFPTEPTITAKAATLGTGIPVVFAMAGLEESNIVESLRQPGGNITGIRFPGPELTVKRLEILHELMPQAKRVYLIYDSNYPNTHSALEQLRPAAPSLGITLVEDPVTNMEELQAALKRRAALDDIGIDAILIMPEILTQTPDGWAAITAFAAEHKLPIAGALSMTAHIGAVFGYSPDHIKMGMLAAAQTDKIFKGTQAGTIPIATPEYRLVINYKVAHELNLTVSESLLARADEIIR